MLNGLVKEVYGKGKYSCKIGSVRMIMNCEKGSKPGLAFPSY